MSMLRTARLPLCDVAEAVRECFPKIRRAALLLCGDPWDADDLAQETFLVLARDPAAFAGRSQLSTWLYGVLVNLERHRRRDRELDQRKLRVLWNGAVESEPEPPALAAAAEWRRSVWGEVARLPDGQRQALVLRYSEHLELAEIAQALDCPLGTVKSRLFHGLAALRRGLSVSRPPRPAAVHRPPAAKARPELERQEASDDA